MKWAFFFLLLISISNQVRSQQPALVIPDKSLIPESITYNKVTKEFLVAGISGRKIVAIKKGGASRDFIQSSQDGFMSGLGLHIDADRQILWAISGSAVNNLHHTGIWAYEAGSGKLIKKWLLSDSADIAFNDLAIDRKGNVYITESAGSRVYYLEMRMDKPRLLFTLPKNNYPNGIVISGERFLFIACYLKGIVCYDVLTKQNWELKEPANVNTRGLDGLCWYKNSLIGVDNSAQDPLKHKITQFYLSRDAKSISKARVIDQHNPYFDIPTSAVIVDGTLFVLANSQLENWDEKKLMIKDPSALKNIYILSYDLSPAGLLLL